MERIWELRGSRDGKKSNLIFILIVSINFSNVSLINNYKMLILEMASVIIISMNCAIAIIAQGQPRQKPVMKDCKPTGYANLCQCIHICTLILSLLKTGHMPSFSWREIPKKCSVWLCSWILPNDPHGDRDAKETCFWSSAQAKMWPTNKHLCWTVNLK